MKILNNFGKEMKKVMNHNYLHKRIKTMTGMREASSEKHGPRRKTSSVTYGCGGSFRLKGNILKDCVIKKKQV